MLKYSLPGWPSSHNGVKSKPLKNASKFTKKMAKKFNFHIKKFANNWFFLKFETVCTLASKKCFFLDGYCNSFAKFILELIFSNIEELRRFSSFFGQEVNSNCYLRSSGQNFKCDKGEVLPKLVSPHSWPPNILQHHKNTAD